MPSKAAAETRPHAGEVEQRLFTAAITPWLTPSTRAVELGPGDGRWTTRMAPLVRELVVVDASAAMLERTRASLARTGMMNVSFLVSSGRDLSPLASDAFDLVFGYDVFGQMAVTETLVYLAEIARVLTDGGAALLHHVLNDAAHALDELESRNGGGPLHVHGRDALDRMYARFGLRIESVWVDGCTAIVLARKPTDSLVPRLEQALRAAVNARDERTLENASRTLMDLGATLEGRLISLAAELSTTAPGAERVALVQRIRRLVRG